MSKKVGYNLEEKQLIRMNIEIIQGKRLDILETIAERAYPMGWG